MSPEIETPNLIIRKARIDDANDWSDILYNSIKNTYTRFENVSESILDFYNKDRLKTQFIEDVISCNSKKSKIELYMLVFDGDSVGILKIGEPIRLYVDGHNYYRENIDGIGEIKTLHIKEEFRGKGIGSRAIIFAENRLKELNYKISHIWVKKPNKNAIAFYKKMGFTETNFINPNTSDKIPSIVLEKEIDL